MSPILRTFSVLSVLLSSCGFSELFAQTEVVTVQGNLPRYNYRDTSGSLIWAMPANSVLWKVDGPINAGVVIVTAAAPSNSLVLNEGGVSVHGGGFPNAKLQVGTLTSATEPGEVRIDSGKSGKPLVHAVNASTSSLMVLETQSATNAALFQMTTPNSSFSQTLATNWALRDNINSVNPIVVVPGNKNSNTLVIKNGNIGVGVTNPTVPLVLANGAKCSIGGVWTNASSRTLKDGISDLSADDAIRTLSELQPVTYSYKAEPEEKHAGFIAEDVPELVATESRTELSPMDFVAVLTKVVQDQQKRLDDQDRQIEEQAKLLQRQNELLEKLAEKLK